jgi:hypothetical protein
MGEVRQAEAPRVRPAYRSEQGRRRFDAAYDALPARWPLPVEVLDLASVYGRTRVHVCGAPDGAPLLEPAAIASGDVRRSRVVIARRPADDALRACSMPIRVLVSERSRAHDITVVAERAVRVLPRVEVVVVLGATHHSLPTEHGDLLAAQLRLA